MSYDFSWLSRVDQNKILFVYVSETSKIHILQSQPPLSKYDNIILYKSISATDMYPLDVEWSEHSSQICRSFIENVSNSTIASYEYGILDAILNGRVVIAPRIALYEELFGNAICYIDSITDYELETDCELETNPELQQQYIERGMNLREKFVNTIISKQLLCALEQPTIIDNSRSNSP